MSNSNSKAGQSQIVAEPKVVFKCCRACNGLFSLKLDKCPKCGEILEAVWKFAGD